MVNRILIIGGGTCSGKTTLAHKLAQEENGAVFSVDDRLGHYAEEGIAFLPEITKEMKAEELRAADRWFPYLHQISIAREANSAVPSPPKLSMFVVNSPPAAYIFPRLLRISFEQL